MTATLNVSPDRDEFAPARRRGGLRRKLTFDRISFMVVFLGLPLALIGGKAVLVLPLGALILLLRSGRRR